MSPRFQARVTTLVGGFIALLGLWWSISAACCSGWPTVFSFSIAALGLAILALGLWALLSRGGETGFVRRNSLLTTLVLLTIGVGLLAHAVNGIRRERTFAMVWQETLAYYGSKSSGVPEGVVLRYESDPHYFYQVEDKELAAYLSRLPDHRVQATFEMTYVFGSLRMMRLVRVGGLVNPAGFSVSSGLRREAGGKSPWD
jgi:hypothetical protein